MIKLTSLDVAEGAPIYVPVESIELIETDIHNGLTVVVCGRSRKHVEESPEEVARKVLEWQLVMERFRVSYQSSTNLLLPNEINTEYQAVMKELHRVSGLSAEKGVEG